MKKLEESSFISFIKEQLEDISQNIEMKTNFSDIDNWDSLTEMLIIVNLRESYGIEINIQELKACILIEDLYSLITSKL